MISFAFVLALALAIACICLGSTWAAPAFAQSQSPCQPVCKDGEYCNEKSAPPSCTPCLNCADHKRLAGRNSCAKSEADCGESDYPDYDYDSEGGEDYSANTTGLDTSLRNANTGHEERPTKKPGPNPAQRPDHGHPKDTPTDYVTPILTTAGILAAIVIGLVCALGRRPHFFAQGGRLGVKRRRTGAAHFRNVPQGDELGQPGVDEDVQFYDQNVRRPARSNEDHGQDVLVALLHEELFPPPGEPVEVQQPADPNRLLDEEAVVPLDHNMNDAAAPEEVQVGPGEQPNYADFRNVPEEDELGQPGIDGDVPFYDQNEDQPAIYPAVPAEAQQPNPDGRGDEDFVPLDPNEVAALRANNVNHMNEAAAELEEVLVEDNFVEVIPDVRAHLDHELEPEGGDDENLPGDPNESENDSDDDEDEAEERHVPQFPAIQIPQSAQDNPIARLIYILPQLLRILNHHQHANIANREEREAEAA